MHDALGARHQLPGWRRQFPWRLAELTVAKRRELLTMWAFRSSPQSIRVSDRHLRIIVVGLLIREPTGGQAWHYLNYLHGLAELGHDVYYIEDSDDTPLCWDPRLSGVASEDPTYGLEFAAAALYRLGLGDRWAYFDAHRNQWKGPRAFDARELCETADLLLNISNVNPIREWLARPPVRVVIDTDPGFCQIRNLSDTQFRARCASHTHFFSFGVNIGKPFCSVPDDGFEWQPTVQPVSLSAWPYDGAGPRDGKYTTVMQWRSFPAPFQWNGLRLAMKSDSFPPFSKLPNRLGDIFDLAVRGGAAELSELRSAGWGTADIDNVSHDPWSFQAFIQRSKAEFGIAKSGYVVTRGGWFSERSANYLAAGRPVLHQDTGLSEWLPCGKGMLPFLSPNDASEAIAIVNADYAAHCRAARDLAEEYFAASRVLPALLDIAMG